MRSYAFCCFLFPTLKRGTNGWAHHRQRAVLFDYEHTSMCNTSIFLMFYKSCVDKNKVQDSMDIYFKIHHKNIVLTLYWKRAVFYVNYGIEALKFWGLRVKPNLDQFASKKKFCLFKTWNFDAYLKISTIKFDWTNWMVL